MTFQDVIGLVILMVGIGVGVGIDILLLGGGRRTPDPVMTDTAYVAMRQAYADGRIELDEFERQVERYLRGEKPPAELGESEALDLILELGGNTQGTDVLGYKRPAGELDRRDSRKRVLHGRPINPKTMVKAQQAAMVKAQQDIFRGLGISAAKSAQLAQRALHVQRGLAKRNRAKYGPGRWGVCKDAHDGIWHDEHVVMRDGRCVRCLAVIWRDPRDFMRKSVL